jgi:class 3 adenylate cyclase
MTDDQRPTLEAARDASRRRAWQEAYTLLSAADTAQPLEPEDLDRLADAAWWTGQLGTCIAVRERAYAAYVSSGRGRSASVVAAELARNHFAKGDAAIGSAWLSRAERLAADHPGTLEAGYVARMRCVYELEGRHDLERALGLAAQVIEIATRAGDPDLMAMSLHDQGRILVAMGRVDEGMAMMDEATVAAIAGELGPLATAIIYCNMIVACKDLTDHDRAREWSNAAKRWCERQAIAGFPGMCRVYRAGILRLGGALVEAEQEARRACEELRDFNRSYCGEAIYELGETRLRLGDLPAAEEAFRQAHELGRDPQPGLSLLRLAEGHAAAALAAIRRALDDPSRDRLHRAHLLPAAVDIAIAAGDLDAADAAAQELESIAAAFRTAALQGAACGARGVWDLAQGDHTGAVRALRSAVQLWQRVECPYEAAQARVALAQAYRAGDDEQAALMELQAAKAAFDRLGARLDAQRAQAALGPQPPSEAGSAGTEPATRTFMFTDIVRSTSLVEAIGDAAWTDLARWHDETLRMLFAQHSGEEIDHAGDGFFVAFVTPAHAIDCAVAIQRTLADHRRRHGFAPQVRIGLHRTRAHRRGIGYRGKGIHAAARIAALAEGEEIIASAETVAAASPGVTCSPARTVALRGLSDPVQIVTIEWH